MSILSDLASELGISPDVLRAELMDGGDSEALVPTYLTTAPDGTVSATFSGHISASGVDLQPYTSADTETDQVRWIDHNGYVVAQISGGEVGNNSLNLQANSGGAGSPFDQAAAILRSRHSPASSTIITQADGTDGGRITVSATDVTGTVANTRKLVAGDGTSDFLFSPPAPASAAYVFGTSRRPNTTRPTLVFASIHVGGQSASTGVIQVNIGTFSPAGTGIATLTLSNVNAPVVDMTIPITFIVPPNYFYSIVQVSGAGGTMNSLFEYPM